MDSNSQANVLLFVDDMGRPITNLLNFLQNFDTFWLLMLMLIQNTIQITFFRINELMLMVLN